MNKWVRVVNYNGAVVGGGNEVPRERDRGVSRDEEGQRGDGGSVVKRADLGRSREVVDFDGVVGAASHGDGTGNGGTLDRGEVGREGEERD